MMTTTIAEPDVWVVTHARAHDDDRRESKTFDNPFDAAFQASAWIIRYPDSRVTVMPSYEFKKDNYDTTIVSPVTVAQLFTD